MPSPKRLGVSVNPVLPHWIAAGAIAVTLAAGLLRYIFIGKSHSTRVACHLEGRRYRLV